MRLNLTSSGWWRLGIAVAGVGLVAAAGAYALKVQLRAAASQHMAAPVAVVDAAELLIDASFFTLAVTKWALPAGSGFPKITVAGSRLLIATSAGELFYADTSAPFVEPTEKTPSPPVAPLPLERLELRIPTDMAVFSKTNIDKFTGFGVGDIHAEPRADGFHDLYASYGKIVGRNCMVLRVAVAEAFDRPGASWRTLFDSKPCFPIAHPADRIAGRIRIHDGWLYVTVGYNGLDDKIVLADRPTEENPQRDDNSYGKIFRIELLNGATQMVSRGHRNPQGLYIDPEGRVFETEHGPRGGDELNLIVDGGNYGWPAVTLGAQYDHHYWPPAAAQNRHDGFAKPIYAWVPSIAVSEIVGMEDEGFGPWRGDFLIASLIAERLYRVHLDDGRVLVAEPIEIGHRLRDLTLDKDTIYLSTDDDRIIRIRLVAEPVT